MIYHCLLFADDTKVYSCVMDNAKIITFNVPGVLEDLMLRNITWTSDTEIGRGLLGNNLAA